MWQYIIKRTLLTFPVLFIVSLFTFSILHLAPGDPAAVLLGGEYIQFATIEDIEEARRALGVDKPPITQYLDWILGIFQGDFGTSLFTGQSVIKLISYGAEASVTLMITSIILSLGIGIPLGILAGWKMNSYIDRSAMIFSVFGFCIPSFWLASGIIYICLLYTSPSPRD